MTRGPSPYKGLASFDDSEHDALFFFGREREREIIAANLMASRLTVLYGETGVGKSSILHAGVVRHLRELPDPGAVVVFDDWQDDPAASLRHAVAAASGLEPSDTLADTLEATAAVVGGEVLVILDGFEEYFLYHGSEAGAGTFLEDFSEAVTRPGLRAAFLLAIREDALAKIDRFKGRIPNLFGNYLRLDHLDRTAGREAIRGPVDRYNELDGDGKVEIEPALVEAVLDQVAAGKVEMGRSGRGASGGEAAGGQIEAPYLQLVMARLWETEVDRGSRALRFETLVALGGAEQIVQDHLEAALGALGPDQRDIAAAVFNQLVTPSGAKIAHDASDLAGYLGTEPDRVEPVLESLAAERILRPVPGRAGSDLPRYEIYHDILGEPVLAWRARHEAEREVERVRVAGARRHRRLLVIAVAAVILAAAMIGVTIFALTQRSEADSQARRAKARALDASALSQLQVDPELSLALAVEAAKYDRGGQVEDVLRRALLASRVRGRFTADGPVVTARYSRDGSKILVAAGSRARVYDAGSRRQLLLLDQKAPITAADFSPSGRVIVTAGDDGKLRIWSAETGRLLRTLRNGAAVRSAHFDRGGSRLVAAGGHVVNAWRVTDGRRLFSQRFGWPVTNAVFGPGGNRLLVIGNHPAALLYTVAGGKLVRSFSQGDFVKDAAFSPDGTLLVTGGQNKTALVWNVRTGTLLDTLPHQGEVLAVAFSPDGRNVATASSDGFGRIWDVSKGTLVAPLIGHSHFVVAVAYSGDGNSLVTSSTDGTARVWDAHSGKFLTLLAGDGDSVTQAYFSPNGRRVLTGSDDGTARLWDPQIQPQLRPVAALPGPIAGASYLPGGLVLTAGPGRAAWLVRTSDGRPVRKFRVGKNVTAAAATPDLQRIAVASGTTVSLFNGSGKRIRSFSQPKVVEAVALSGDQLATGGTDGVIRIWSLTKGGAPRELHGHTKTITDLAFSPDGRLLASASRDATARIWDPASGKKLRVLAQNKNDVNSVAFSPDGRSLLTASKDADAKIWDVATGGRRQLLRWHFGAVNDAEFSPDGNWIVTTGPSTLQLWQPDVRESLFSRLGVKGVGGMLAAVFDPASERLSAVTGDGRLLTYRCTICGGLAQLLPVARDRLARTGRTLTAAERKRYEG